MILIGIYADCPESGKSTLAEGLAKEFGLYRGSFSNPIKAMLTELLHHCGIWNPHHYLNVDKDKVIPELADMKVNTGRELMTTLGSGWGRNVVGEGIWVKAFEEKCGPFLVPQVGLVCDDIRHLNELEKFRKLGGITIRVVMKGQTLKEGVDYVGSEGNLDDEIFDLVLESNGFRRDLEAQGVAAVKELLKQRKTTNS